LLFVISASAVTRPEPDTPAPFGLGERFGDFA
jgi:hypothetical protein